MVAGASQPNFPLNLPGQGRKVNGSGLITVAARQRKEPKNRVSPASPTERGSRPLQSPTPNKVCSLDLTLLSRTVEEHLSGLSHPPLLIYHRLLLVPQETQPRMTSLAGGVGELT